MADRTGKCTNFENCHLADSKELVTIPDGEEFVCPNPDCGKELMEVRKTNGPGRKGLVAAVVAAVVIVGGLTGFLFWPSNDGPVIPDDTTVVDEPPEPDVGEPPPAEPPPVEPVTVSGVVDKLKAGDLEAAAAAVRRLEAESPEAVELKGLMTKPVDLDVRFQFRKSGQQASQQYPIGSDQLERLNLTLTHEDDYALFLKAPAGSPEIYAYVFQIDQYDEVSRVFPHPAYGGGDNPIAAGESRRIPPEDGQWLYLDELSASDQAIGETIHVVASFWPADDLNEQLGRIHQETRSQERKAKVRELVSWLKKRGQSGLPCVYYNELTFTHDHPRLR